MTRQLLGALDEGDHPPIVSFELSMQQADRIPTIKPPAITPGPGLQPGVHPVQEKSVSLPDVTLNCATGPANGPPLVLIHGVTRCWHDFGALLPTLTDRWQVLALDLRGHGRSSHTAADYRVRDYAADVAAWLAREVPQPAVLFGHSLGAMVAALVSAQSPGRVRALVLEDPPGSTLGERICDSRFYLQFAGIQRLLAQPRTVEELTRELADLPVQRPSDGAVVKFSELRDLESLRFGAQCLARIDRRVLDVLIDGRWLEGIDWFASLRQIPCPTLLLRADPKCGGMLTEPEAARIESLIPRCTRVDLPGVSHAIHSTQPGKTLELLSAFLKSIEVQPAANPT